MKMYVWNSAGSLHIHYITNFITNYTSNFIIWLMFSSAKHLYFIYVFYLFMCFIMCFIIIV
jgi:hypothetical protein